MANPHKDLRSPRTNFGQSTEEGRASEIELKSSRMELMHKWTHANLGALTELTFEPPCAGASPRKYFRVHVGSTGHSIIIMDAPPSVVDCMGYLRAAREMKGILAPDVIKFDKDAGFMMLSDLGRFTLYDLLPLPLDEVRRLFQLSIDGIVAIQGIRATAHTPVYDGHKMRDETNQFLEKFIEGCSPRPISNTARSKIARELEQLVALCESQPRQYCHFDYYSRNIIPATSKVHAVDIQDACLAPWTYDLASLLRDVNVCLPQPVHDELVEYFVSSIEARMHRVDRRSFMRQYYAMSLHRHLRILSTFVELAYAGKPEYLFSFPLILKYINEECSYLGELELTTSLTSIHIDAVIDKTIH